MSHLSRSNLTFADVHLQIKLGEGSLKEAKLPNVYVATAVHVICFHFLG
jgi:hypothetical protein